ncbi:MAG TPA: circularly permuted type 2 ATP-grasp protein [Hyphomicrobium sp.]|nr:circularly permuted type 2 ATP-grasp protein [Hyphomicrobium sp.]
MLDAYRRSRVAGYDELLSSDGTPRRHWASLLAGLNDLTQTDRTARAARLDRRVRETGIAYDIFADPRKGPPQWQLDLVPIVISSAEWRWLEAALVQRAELFDALLNDLYGDQNLLRDGMLPAELIFSDSTYLRPCQGILPRAGGLRFYAADLARGTDGQWRIIDNHAETLAGIGFALANRMVHTHVAGDHFNATNAVRLASYFQSMQSALTAHCGRENARIALLTPGAHHEDYFSHAYIARYLGYLLVEGADLRTRGGQVFIKTLEGLKEIDLVVRCVDGRVSDPLELDPGGYDGPSGLVRTTRASPKLVVNAIGSALVQNRGLGPYLQRLSRHLLSEDLKLHDAPRWWLGDGTARQHLEDRFADLVIRKAQEGTGRPGQAALGRDTHAMTDNERDQLKREIALHGSQLVAEEKIGFSTAPAMTDGGLSPRPFAMRMFVARTQSGYVAMPGGLAMTIDPDRAVALSAPDGHTRDVWVLSDAEQGHHVSLWRPTLETARVQRSQRAIQSRVADDMFWLGRYAERADWTMRVLRSALRRLAEDSGPASGLSAARKYVEVLVTSEDATPAVKARIAGYDLEALCRHLISGGDISSTLERTTTRLYKVAHVARDRLSLEAFQTLSRFRPGDPWTTAITAATPGGALDLLDEGLSAIAAFNGLMHENMTRNFGWSFIDMGRRLERAYNLSEAMLSLFIPVEDAEDEESSLMLLLELADSFITYRSRYRLNPMLALVLDLLLLDETNPRSLSYQLAAFSRQLEMLPESIQGVSLTEDRRLILALLTSIRLADVERMAQEPSRITLEKLLTEQIQLLPELSDAVGRHYFNLTEDELHRQHMRSDAPQ